jgi:hypothetical protein
LARLDFRKAEIYAFCPYVIFISVVWGMFDAIVAIFLLLSYLTFSKQSYFLAGLTYGVSLVKLYTAVLAPLYVYRLLGRWKELGEFLLGFSFTLIPVAYYFIVSPSAFWNVVVVFQGLRVMGGVNLYNFIWNVPDVIFDVLLSTVASAATIIGVAYVILKYGRRLPLLEAVLAVMLMSFLFGKIMNEQFLVAIFPLILLCKKCDYRLWAAPFIFIFLRSAFYYFAIPILWASPYFYDLYFQADIVWRQIQTAGYLMVPVYATGIAFSLLILWNLLQLLKPIRSWEDISLSRTFSRVVRTRRK